MSRSASDARVTVHGAAAATKAKADTDKKDGKCQLDRNEERGTQFPAGSYIVRMDQPYSRIADALLDRQYWSPNDPQKHPYDDTAWSMGDLFDVEVVRVTDNAILKAPMSKSRHRQQSEGLAAVDIRRQGKLPRIALMHTWLDTQTEGWWRMALDQLHVKYDYISTQDVARKIATCAASTT